MEEAGIREAVESVHRQLCRRPCDLLSHGSRRSSHRDADHDVEAEVDSEREQDTDLPAAGREVRLSGLHVRALLLDEEGTGLSGHGAFQETGTTHLSSD